MHIPTYYKVVSPFTFCRYVDLHFLKLIFVCLFVFYTLQAQNEKMKSLKIYQLSVPFLPHYHFPIRKTSSALNKPVINIPMIWCLIFQTSQTSQVWNVSSLHKSSWSHRCRHSKMKCSVLYRLCSDCYYKSHYKKYSEWQKKGWQSTK